MVGRQTGRDRSSKICKGSEGTRRRDLLPDKQTFQRANKMGACPRECVPKLRVTEPLLCTKTFIPFYPNTLPGVPKPSRASRAPSSVIISLGWSRGATTRLENRWTRKGLGGSNPSSSATKPKAAVESERLHLSLKRATAQAAFSSQHCANTCSDATRCAAGPSRRDVGRAFGCGRVCNTRPTLARAGLAPQSAPWFSKVSSVWFAAIPGP